MTRTKHCCICKALRPASASRAMGEGWRGCRVLARGQRSHWICGRHDRTLHDVIDHAEDVADGIIVCEIA